MERARSKIYVRETECQPPIGRLIYNLDLSVISFSASPFRAKYLRVEQLRPAGNGKTVIKRNDRAKDVKGSSWKVL